ncbi:hypothetical protein BH24ACT22_BH24ACT22_02600 [soil metagenome]
MRRSLLNDVSYVAVEDGQVVGFGTLRSDRDEKAEISWIAIDAARRREGIGRGLLSRIEENLTERNAKSLMVKTLSKEVDYPTFESTRRFYEQNGFVHVETVEHYDGWEGDPQAIYEKVLV